MSDDLNWLRREVAAERGLPAEAVSFLTGTSVEQVEASADALAQLVGRSDLREQEPADPLAGLFANGGAEKARRQRALLQTLHGLPPQQRDEGGRFSGGGFDGGARQTAPEMVPPETAHDDLLLDRLAAARGAPSSGW